MQTTSKIIYALDFDGVICDSAIETSITGWKATQKIWQDMPDSTAPELLINNFRRVRPFLETGYEAILIIRLLYLGISVNTLCENYHSQIQTLIQSENLDILQLKQIFGATRDSWIKQAPQQWLEMNPLFSGVKSRLKTLTDNTWYIITTKQKRFVENILQEQQINIDYQAIFGMESKMSKQETLLKLLKKHPKQKIIFIEDRLPTLLNIKNNQQLQKIKLQLVDWGYNTDADKEKALQNQIELITVDQFIQIS